MGAPLVFINTIRGELRSLNGSLFRFRRKRRKTTIKRTTMKKNIAEILEDQHEGLQLWSPAYGKVELKKATDTGVIIRTKCGYAQLNVDGTLSADGECMLFPSPEQRDWEEFRKTKEKVEKFDINTLKPFDRVLARDGNEALWAIELWMAYKPQYKKWKYQCLGSTYDQCIPYEGNEHLLLTADMPDEYYITWEEKNEEGNEQGSTML